jgi:thiopurine S-methyltransferase
MEADFWHQRWRENQIGFHLDEVVPLCGKSRDLGWLAAQGYHVVGVELSPLAVEAFFKEHGLSPQKKSHGHVDGHYVQGVEIWCGDFFEMHRSQIGHVDAIYDRAALIALPESMRGRYVQHLLALTGRVPQLLVTLDYPATQMEGPPFPVTSQEVARRYGDHYHAIQPHICYDTLGSDKRYAERGLSRLAECVYLLRA